jgi:hypothetical protein
MASSSSTILTQVLNTETAEWRETIDAFMEQKITDFRAAMKASIEKTMTDKLNHFYNRSFDDHDAVLFDKDGTDIIKKTIVSMETNRHNGYLSAEGRKMAQQELNELGQIVKTSGDKCFQLVCSHYTGNGNDTNAIYIFKHFMISNSKHSYDNVDRPVYIKHNLANDILFTIKHFQMPQSGGFEAPLKLYRDHPEYFKRNCTEFEGICKREYDAIQVKKDELQCLIDENQAKIDHYRGLEEEIQAVKVEKLAIEEEKAKLKDGKEQLLLAKQKIAVMKADIEKERQQLEEEKNKHRADNFDMDGFLNA